jgi:hypothetical protein
MSSYYYTKSTSWVSIVYPEEKILALSGVGPVADCYRLKNPVCFKILKKRYQNGLTSKL